MTPASSSQLILADHACLDYAPEHSQQGGLGK
jgi:hypothetical protein